MRDISAGRSDVGFSLVLKIVTIVIIPFILSVCVSVFFTAPKCVLLCHILCVCFREHLNKGSMQVLVVTQGVFSAAHKAVATCIRSE